MRQNLRERTALRSLVHIPAGAGDAHCRAEVGRTGADPPQRFILFNAEYNSSLKQVSKTTVFLEKRLFKLDTQTGETWVLIDVLQDGRDIRYWQKITDTPQK